MTAQRGMHRRWPPNIDFEQPGGFAYSVQVKKNDVKRYPAGRDAMKVFIAEDERLHAEMLSGIVASWGHVVTAVESGREAVAAAACRRIDLFLLDVFLPDMTAMELIPQLKALQPEARIITLTGQSSRELERKLRELGISYYMAKPFQRDELHCILEHMAGRPCVQGRRRTTNPITNPT
jgi:DNA-binding response OmpR family regulator